LIQSKDSIVKRFSKYLESIEYPEDKTSWNIAGIVKGKNAFYRFDVRDMFHLSTNEIAQKFKTNTEADKLVLETKKDWIILDFKELIEYGKKNNLKKVYLDSLLSNLEWNIVLPK